MVVVAAGMFGGVGADGAGCGGGGGGGGALVASFCGLVGDGLVGEATEVRFFAAVIAA